MEDADPVRHACHLVEVVAGDEDRRSACRSLLEAGTQPDDRQGIQRVAGLIEDEDVGLVEQSRAEADLLPGAQRQRPGPSVDPSRNVQGVDHALDPPGDLFVPYAAEHGRSPEVVPGRELGVARGSLDLVANPAP